MNREELALRIGTSFLDAIQNMQEEKKDFGNSVVVPISLPAIGGQPHFMSSIEISMPRFIHRYFDEEGQPQTKSITMAEYFEWDKSNASKIPPAEAIKT